MNEQDRDDPLDAQEPLEETVGRLLRFGHDALEIDNGQLWTLAQTSA